MTTPYVIAFDFGLRHIGVAVGQTLTRTATPLTTLQARQGKPDWQALTALIAEWRPGTLLVGLPYNMDDTENHVCAHARRFAARLERLTGLPVELVDERLTSVDARARLYETGGGAATRDSHALAAVLIAETWLSSAPELDGA